MKRSAQPGGPAVYVLLKFVLIRIVWFRFLCCVRVLDLFLVSLSISLVSVFVFIMVWFFHCDGHAASDKNKTNNPSQGCLVGTWGDDLGGGGLWENYNSWEIDGGHARRKDRPKKN